MEYYLELHSKKAQKIKTLMCPSVRAIDIHSQLLTRNMKSCLIEIFIIKLWILRWCNNKVYNCKVVQNPFIYE